MSKQTDPSMYESKFERAPGDTYYTEPWVTELLLRYIPQIQDERVWEPACGRGDISRVLSTVGCCDVLSSDIETTQFNLENSYVFKGDFLAVEPAPQFKAIVTNPPYYKDGKVSMAEKFVRHALKFEQIEIIAMLMRSEFMHTASRADLFTEQNNFAFELLLPRRPRWDWWFRDKPLASPRHPYSWFIWDRKWNKPPTFICGKELK